MTSSPSVKLYQPDARVTLYKTVKRSTLNGQTVVSDRFQGLDRQINLTPYLSEQAGLRTSKSVIEPAGGFSITLADKPYKGQGSFETLAGIIEPMDFVEIRLRHDPPDLIGNIINGAATDPTRPPIIMRGFVSEVTRTEMMGPDGRPQQAVIIGGQDYGKLWQQLQILYFPNYVIGEDLLTNFKLFEQFSTGFKTTMSSNELVTEIVQKILNPYIAGIFPNSPQNRNEVTIPNAVLLDTSVKYGTSSVTGPQNQEGSIYNLLRTYSDVGIWNELFLEDREDGVYCVFRPNPSKDISGSPIYTQAYVDADYKSPPTVDLLDYDIMSMSLSRTDANVANFYWVRAPRFDLVSDVFRQLYAIQSDDPSMAVDQGTYTNSAMALYGTRVMYAQTEQGGDSVDTFNSGLSQNEDKARALDMSKWLQSRRLFMALQNRDNVLLERGSMRVRGNENIRPGTFIRLHRGSFSAEYYVTQVDHDYVPFTGFFSTLTLDRGMGFVERVKRGGGAASPYLAERQETPRGQ